MTKTRMIKATCSKCGETFSLDIGEMTKEEVIDLLEKKDHFECPGHHVEFGSPLRYWELDWNSLDEKETVSEEDWLNDLKGRYKYVFSTQEFSENVVDVGFSFGLATGRLKETGEKLVFDFTRSPKGNRFYFS